MSEFFSNRTLGIVTKHQKEALIGPLFQEAFGWEYALLEVDTDQLGTFTGEIEREADPLTTARKKVALVNDDAHDLVIVSEGSFGPHPAVGFIAADDELLLLYDCKSKEEFIVRHITAETNFNGQEVSNAEELHNFLVRVKFPEHAVIIRESRAGKVVEKGIHSLEKVKSLSNLFFEKKSSVYIETDMRAMHNPMRQNAIIETCKKLIEKLRSACPECHHPGYDVSEVISGLPCMNCFYPTRSTLSYLYHCKKCDYTEEKKYPHGKSHEDPMYCDHCNP